MAATLAQVLGNKRIALMLPLGFISGLPLALTSGTLQAWLTVAGVDLKTIGIFTLVGLPYSMKFLWAPVMDRVAPPWLGRRRGWMVATQIAVAVGLAMMGLVGTDGGPQWLGIIAVAVAFTSASLDIVFDAYRTDVLLAAERGFGAAVWVNGYRLALLLASAGALVLAEYIGWRGTYLTLSGLMGAGVVTVFLSPDPPPAGAPQSLAQAIGQPVRELFSRPGIYGLLSLVVLYKIGDAVAGSLQTAFFIGGLGFTAGEVGYVKGLGIAATLIGALAGGMVMAKTGLARSLLVFGILQALSNLAFMLLAWMGKSYEALAASVVIENVTGGMGTAAFVALVMSLCDHRYTATQFALLSSLEALGRVFSGRPSAEVVSVVGWGWFFLFSFLLALPGCWLVWRYGGQLNPEASEPAAPRSPLMKPA
jgi:PAT family beta-lactamase induction signal transducer AmpG